MSHPTPSKRVKVALLGSSGSVGLSCQKVLAEHQKWFQLTFASAFSKEDVMLQLVEKFKPKAVHLVHPQARQSLKNKLQGLSHTTSATEVLEFENWDWLDEVEVVIMAIAGSAALPILVEVVQRSKIVLIANKESLVMGGHWLVDLCQKHQSTLMPLDSEHNAIWQCLPQNTRLQSADLAQKSCLHSITLTASGGALFDASQGSISPQFKAKNVSVSQALNHPNWDMGDKITIDSATMMNKGLEVAEACFLFGLKPYQVKALIHPQSLIHGLAHFKDGATLLQMAKPDMSLSISFALSQALLALNQNSNSLDKNFLRLKNPIEAVDLAQMRLDFFDITAEDYPCYYLALQALKSGGNALVVLNAANEVAVEAFLQDKISFHQIYEVVEQTLSHSHQPQPMISFAHIQSIHLESGQFAKQLVSYL